MLPLKLCNPAQLYLVISSITIVIMLFQNIGTSNMLCVGSLSCNVPSITLIFAVKIIYVLFWTWILNLICKSGHSKIAWFLVLLPFILFFIILLSIISFYQ